MTSKQNIPVAGCAALLALASLVGSTAAQQSFQLSYRFLWESPSAAEPQWADNAQGLAHNQSHWFVTNNQGEIWKIPVSADLCCTTEGDPGVSVRRIGEIPVTGYSEFKDPVCRQSQGIWYLFVPMAGNDLPTAVAVFRADTLAYLGHRIYINEPPLPFGGNPLPSWCAINGEGHLVLPYRFAGLTDGIVEFTINWTALAAPQPQLITTFIRAVHLLREDGISIFFENPQGGEFSEDGRILYTTSGYLDDTEIEQVTEGLHAFDTTTWMRIAHSTNGYGIFNYHYDPDGLINQEPQGMTVWDLDNGAAPGVFGQLHVMMINNDGAPDSDNIHISHYTNRIWVNAAAGPGDGTIPAPYPTVTQAVGLAWDGSEIWAQPGVYDEALAINRRVRLIANGGTVRIGG